MKIFHNWRFMIGIVMANFRYPSTNLMLAGEQSSLSLSPYVYIYNYMYIYICMCMYMYMYMYVYIYMYK